MRQAQRDRREKRGTQRWKERSLKWWGKYLPNVPISEIGERSPERVSALPKSHRKLVAESALGGKPADS